jgi:hypothetical protein
MQQGRSTDVLGLRAAAAAAANATARHQRAGGLTAALAAAPWMLRTRTCVCNASMSTQAPGQSAAAAAADTATTGRCASVLASRSCSVMSTAASPLHISHPPTPPASSPPRLYLLDAKAQVYRLSHGYGEAASPAAGGAAGGGEESSLVAHGFVQVLLTLFNHKPPPTHMAVVVDAPGATFRNLLYPQYKAGRSEAPAGATGSASVVEYRND